MGCCFCIVIRCFKRTAGRLWIIINKSPARREHICIKLSRNPAIRTDNREGFRARELLIKVAAGNYVISLCIFWINKILKHLCLSNFSFTAVVSFKMEVYKYKLAARITTVFINRDAGNQHTALEVCNSGWPGKWDRKGTSLSRKSFKACMNWNTTANKPHWRERNWNKYALVVIGKGTALSCKAVNSFVLIYFIRAFWFLVYFLNKKNVRIVSSNGRFDSLEILFYICLWFWKTGFSTVHEKVFIFTESRITDIPAHNWVAFAWNKHFVFAGKGNIFYWFRPVFNNS